MYKTYCIYFFDMLIYWYLDMVINFNPQLKGSDIRAKLPKSGKLEKSKNNYNFFKIVLIVVKFFSGIVKFDFGLRNNILEFAPSFVLFKKTILCFWDKFVQKMGQKVGDFNITFQKERIFFSSQAFSPCFYTPIGL